MPRIQTSKLNKAAGERKTLLESVRGKMGMVPNLLATLARAPAALKAYLDLNANLAKGTLAPVLREQIALTIAEVNNGEYGLAAHGAMARVFRLSDEAIRANRAARSSDPATEAALRFAQAVVASRGFVRDVELAEVNASGYDEALLEIVTLVALNTLTNYASHVAGVEVDIPRVKPLGKAA